MFITVHILFTMITLFDLVWNYMKVKWTTYRLCVAKLQTPASICYLFASLPHGSRALISLSSPDIGFQPNPVWFLSSSLRLRSPIRTNALCLSLFIDLVFWYHRAVDLLFCFSAIRNQNDMFPLFSFFDIMVLICYLPVVFRSMECFCPEEERFAYSLEQDGTWLSHDFTIIENHFSADKTPEIGRASCRERV